MMMLYGVSFIPISIVVVLLACVDVTDGIKLNSNRLIPFTSQTSSAIPLSQLLILRGGSKQELLKKKNNKEKKRKKRKSSSSSSSSRSNSSETSKSAIKEALKEDAATAMGDAIRARSSDLLQDDLTQPMNHGDITLNSISYAIGSSEQQSQKKTTISKLSTKTQNDSYSSTSSSTSSSISSDILHDGGSVEPSSSAVIANYFLTSHGGLHGIQSIMSLLSVLFGLGSFAIPSSNLSLQLRMVQRTLICALSKHISGFVAAAIASASQLPDIGWRETRMRMESFALDPIAQYLFYCALLSLWINGVSTTLINSSGNVQSKLSNVAKEAMNAAASAATTTASTSSSTTTQIIPWWLKESRKIYCIICIIGPILLREVVSTIWVISDVLILYHSSKFGSEPSILLKAGSNIIDAFMSVLLTPSQWRSANPAMRQKMLAKLVAKTSLGLEIGTGLILSIDAMRAFLDFSLSPVTSRPSIIAVVKRLVCARLYINFLLVRRKKVIDLVHNIRGGFMYVPGRVLDTLLEPQKAMGLDWGAQYHHHHHGTKYDDDDEREDREKSWLKWIGFLAGF